MVTKRIDAPAVAPAKKPGRGGKREGAGRPVKKHVDVATGTPALAFLQQVFESTSVPMPLRVRAATAVVNATVARPGAEHTLGKKAQMLQNAHELAGEGGTFAPGRPPASVLALVGKT